MEKIEVEVLGLSANAGRNGAFALILKEIYGIRRLPILIGSFEAQAIALNRLTVQNLPVPLPHDLIKSFCDNLGANVVEVFIDELKDSTFYAKILIEYSTMTTEIDSRPSDAVALAVRTGAPIYVSSVVMDLASFNPANDTNESPDSDFEDEEEDIFNINEKHDKEPINISEESKIATLQDQLREAIEKEDYERAAKIRDEIEKIKNNLS